MNHQHHQIQPRRLDNTTTCLPIVYGSIAYNLGPDAIDEYHTHRWTLYVRIGPGGSGSNDTNPPPPSSNIISKVLFTLHPSFARPNREVCSPGPYEVSEVGWGEFEASMRIVWNADSRERSTLVTHLIRLYPTTTAMPMPMVAARQHQQQPIDDGGTAISTMESTTAAASTTTSSGSGIDATTTTTETTSNNSSPVISERYDEVVFTNPTIEFHTALIAAAAATTATADAKNATDATGSSNSSVNKKVWSDIEESKIMISAKTYLERRLRTIKERLVYIDMEMDNVKRDTAIALRRQQQQQQLVLPSNTTTTTSNSSVGTTTVGKAELSTSNVTKEKKKMNTTPGEEEGGEGIKKKKKKNTTAAAATATTTSSLGVVL